MVVSFNRTSERCSANFAARVRCGALWLSDPHDLSRANRFAKRSQQLSVLGFAVKMFTNSKSQYLGHLRRYRVSDLNLDFPSRPLEFVAVGEGV